MTYGAERSLLCETGLELLEKGLVARTWGNLSVRVDGAKFLISPSGRTYDSVKPEEVITLPPLHRSPEDPRRVLRRSPGRHHDRR